jgi:O-antigen/teichoic acid export membrane protein
MLSDGESNRDAQHAAKAGARSSMGALARDGATAGVIKLASAGLSFLMFVAVAMVTDERQFGLYSTAYAGASLVSFFSLIGQHAVVMRFWPEYTGRGDTASANGLLARSIVIATAGLAIFSLLILLAALLPLAPSVPEWRPLCLATAVLALALGWSEFTSCAFRAQGDLIGGLLPRDIVWRVAAIAVFVAAGFLAPGMDAVAAVYVTAGLLLLCVAPQTFSLLRDTLQASRGPLSVGQRAEFRTVTLGLWGVTALPPALSQASTLVVAAILGPEAAGAIFVADRVMRLAVLALNGINQALAPQIASAFHNGDRPHVQRITGIAAFGGSAVALLMLAVFALFGKFILSVFDPSYATGTMHAALVILGTGAVVGTACGPTELLLQLTGGQKELFKALLVVNGLGLAVMAALTHVFGPIGAASGIAGTIMVWCVIGVMIARRRVGIDPSILGFLAGEDATSVRRLLRGRA